MNSSAPQKLTALNGMSVYSLGYKVYPETHRNGTSGPIVDVNIPGTAEDARFPIPVREDPLRVASV